MHSRGLDVNEVIHTCVCIGGELAKSDAYPAFDRLNPSVESAATTEQSDTALCEKVATYADVSGTRSDSLGKCIRPRRCCALRYSCRSRRDRDSSHRDRDRSYRTDRAVDAHSQCSVCRVRVDAPRSSGSGSAPREGAGPSPDVLSPRRGQCRVGVGIHRKYVDAEHRHRGVLCRQGRQCGSAGGRYRQFLYRLAQQRPEPRCEQVGVVSDARVTAPHRRGIRGERHQCCRRRIHGRSGCGQPDHSESGLVHGIGFVQWVSRHHGAVLTGLRARHGCQQERRRHEYVGAAGDPDWRNHNPSGNAEALRGKTIYSSASSGLPGAHNTALTLEGATAIVRGGPLEALVHSCTQAFESRLEGLGIAGVFAYRDSGTHSWPYYEDALHDSWPILESALRR